MLPQSLWVHMCPVLLCLEDISMVLSIVSGPPSVEHRLLPIIDHECVPQMNPGPSFIMCNSVDLGLCVLPSSLRVNIIPAQPSSGQAYLLLLAAINALHPAPFPFPQESPSSGPLIPGNLCHSLEALQCPRI